MTWTYSGDPANNTRDQVRYLVGDTDFADQKVEDEEIAWALTEEGNIYHSASRVAMGLSSRFASKANRTIGDLKIDFTSLKTHYRDMAKELTARGVLRGGKPFMGARDRDTKRTVRQDTTRTQPDFRKGLHDTDDPLRVDRARFLEDT